MRFTSPELLSNEILLNVEDLLDVVLTENGLCDRYADASPGEAIVYHIGLLARDRDKVASELLPERREDLEAVARRVWAIRSPEFPRPATRSASSRPAPPNGMEKPLPPAAACSASPRWAKMSNRRRNSPTIPSPASISTACNTAATSATAR